MDVSRISRSLSPNTPVHFGPTSRFGLAPSHIIGTTHCCLILPYTYSSRLPLSIFGGAASAPSPRDLRNRIEGYLTVPIIERQEPLARTSDPSQATIILHLECPIHERRTRDMPEHKVLRCCDSRAILLSNGRNGLKNRRLCAVSLLSTGALCAFFLSTGAPLRGWGRALALTLC